MKQNLTSLTEILSFIPKLLGRFSVLLFVVLVASLYSFLVVGVAQLTQIEPDPDAIEERLERSAGPKIDRQAVEAIEQLQDQNVQIEALFRDARENPFSE